MKAAVFYGVATVASLGAIAAEAAYSRKKKKGWYDAADTVTNLNVGAGNVLAGLVLAVVVAAGYGWLYGHRLAAVSTRLPGWASFVLAVVVADFLQYWNHRLSHDVSFLWAGHVTHHSSRHMNLSTGIRINWLYRGYAWMLYAPMPLLGFDFETFVAAQAVIGTYNLMMHTRLALPFGPLRWLLVTSEAHGLHHSSDPRHYGNYGAALIVWDRLFGTYRETASSEAPDTFGIGRPMGENPLRLNFHHVVDVWRASRAHGLSFVRLFLGPTRLVPESAPSVEALEITRRESTRPRVWIGVAVVAAITLGTQAVAKHGLNAAAVAAIFGGLVVITLFGIALERRPSKASKLCR